MNKICLAGMVVLSLVQGMVQSTTSIVNAMASSPQETATPFTQQVKDADMIFYGVVTKLENVVIGPRPRSEDGPLPHTYVTYQVKESLKGRSPDNGNVTLRFLGGAMSDGRHLESSEMPTFKVGEYDLLFVWKNTETDCPIVDCVKGRFRVLKKGVYADDERPVVGIQKGIFLYGKRGDSSSEPLSIEQVKAAVVDEVNRLYTAEALQGLKPIRSANPDGHELPSFSSEQPAPPVIPPTMSHSPISEADRAEEEAFQQNQGNPVFQRKTVR